MDLMDNIGSQIIVDWNLLAFKAASPEDIDRESFKRILASMIPETHSTSWYAIKNLLSRPWFERLWIWQEVTLPENEVSVLCGYSKVLYNHFCNGIHYLWLCRSSLDMEVLAPAHEVLSFSSRKSKDTLYWLIKATRGCKCSDQRDKIFGILNLTDDQIGIVADYSKPLQEVFQDFITRLLVRTNRLDILDLCFLKDSPLALPTWANWPVPSKSVDLPSQQADAGVKARTFPAGSGVLVATGICVAQVDQIEHTDSFHILFNRNVKGHTAEEWEFARDLGNLATAIVGLGDPRIAEPKIESLCRALCCGEFSFKYLDSEFQPFYPDFRRSIEYTSQCWAWSKWGCSLEDRTIHCPDSCYWHFLGKVAGASPGRSVIKTSNDLIGMAPEITQKEDVVCVLLGCSSPLILRPKEAGHYAIVGECYVDGIMNGETFLGQFPENWRRAQKWFPQYRDFFPVFHDNQSGISQNRDPRLGEIPAGWRYKSHYYQDAYPEYVDDETGEDLGELHPNLRYEALKARGLEFEEFRLV